MLAAAGHPLITFGVVLLIVGIVRMIRPRGIQRQTPLPGDAIPPPRGTIRLEMPVPKPGHEGRARVLAALVAAAGLTLLIVGIMKLG